jgi:hypothetical protein
MTTSSSTGKSRRRRWLARLIVLGGSLIFVVLLAEVLVRIFLPAFNPRKQLAAEIQPGGFPLCPKNATLRQATPKGDFDIMVSTNALGFRDSQDPRQAKPNALFAVGDSFTFGFGVQAHERYSERLAAALGEPVYNVAVWENFIGYQRLLKYVESQGVSVRRLVVGVCMENDLEDYSAGKSVTDRETAAGIGMRAWLQTHSALYLAMSHAIQKVVFLRRIAEATGISRTRGDNVFPSVYDEKVLAGCRDEVLKVVGDRKAVILIVPSRGLWMGGDEATVARIHDRFVILLKEAGLAIADPKARLESGGKPLDYYFKTDPHWNAEGHRVAAEVLAEVVRQSMPSAK